ncbi:MAG: IS3 family transposase [Nitrospira sp.]|nr:IS3 family transposase [Nitrospira sp.]
MKYAFMHAHQQEFRLARMCRVLGVSRSGFYAWVGREPSARAQANQHLTTRIRALHQQTREAYGARKMWQLLNREGVRCGRHRVARLRREAGIIALRRRRYVRTVQARHHEPVTIPNRLNQQFVVSAKNRVWAADYTFVPTRTGWLYVAVILDLYSRRIVGWAMSARQTLTLVADAWWMAWQRRRPAPGLIHHSDQGNQYRAGLYQQLLTHRGVVPSMSRKGNCYDNAPVESFFSSLKNELTRHRDFQHHAEARYAIADYMEVFYNQQRLHQTLGYRSPEEFERQEAGG